MSEEEAGKETPDHKADSDHKADLNHEAPPDRKDGRQNSLVHEPVTGPRPPYDHNLVADAKVKVVQPDGHTQVPRWNSSGKHALPRDRREDR